MCCIEKNLKEVDRVDSDFVYVIEGKRKRCKIWKYKRAFQNFKDAKEDLKWFEEWSPSTKFRIVKFTRECTIE